MRILQNLNNTIMNEDLEYLIWQYVDDGLPEDQKAELQQKINDDALINKKYEDIKALHLQLKSLPVATPEKALNDLVMNQITNSEINAQIHALPNKEKSLIPLIIILFSALILASVVIVYIVSKIGVSANPVSEFPISKKALTFIGYIGMLGMILLILYRISFSQKKV